MTVTDALKHATAKVVLLSEITAGVHCRAWVVNGVFVNSYTITVDDEVTEVRWNRTTLLSYQGSFVDVNSHQGSWYWDRNTKLLWVRPPTGQSMFTNTVQAMVKFYFAYPKIKTLNNRTYAPRLLNAPRLSKRIEAMFGDVGQVGGGTLVFNNVDGLFNGKQRYQWNAGEVVLKMGVDTHAGEMAWADYETVATWIVEEWSRDEVNFQLRVTEAKSKLKSKVPFEIYTRELYPNIEDNDVGKPIPVIYGEVFGAPATLIDPGLKKFKLCSHAIAELSEVRILKNFEESKTRTTTADDWYPYATSVWRYYLSDEETKAVTYGGTAIVEAENLADCIATANRWWTEDNFTYVHPASGADMTTGAYAVQTKKTLTAWDNINFATKDLTNGEFTLGDDWSIGQEISVDLKGKTSAGTLIENSVSIIEDLLTLVGATNLNSASFTAAKAKLVLGTTLTNRTRHTRSASLYTSKATEVLELISDLLKQIGGYLYSDELGQFTVGIFEPEPGEGLPQITDLELMDFGETNATKDIITKVSQSYARRDQDDYAQNLATENTATGYINDQPEPVIFESENTFATKRDARDYGQRTIVYRGSPLRVFTIRTPWTQWLRAPGEQVRFISERYEVDGVFEVLGVETDLGSSAVTLTLGNLRSFEDAPGFWVDSAAVLPTRFSALDGYSGGVIDWNINWDTDIKVWARQNVGYWTDANGFADTDDTQSFIPSCWI
jgi:hypothetical protein